MQTSVKLTCPTCKEELVKYAYMGWAHKPYSNCAFKDGLTYVEYSKDEIKFGFFIVEEEDIENRKLFLRTMNFKEEEALQQNKEPQKEIQLNSQEQNKKEIKRNFLATFEPYF